MTSPARSFVTAWALALLVACGDAKDEAKPAPQGASTVVPSAGLAGRDDDEEAQRAVSLGDMPAAIGSLRRAIQADGECAEDRYDLGAARANLAVSVVGDDEDQAVRVFTESVDSKRRAVDLMDAGKSCIDDEAQQQQVRRDAQRALEDADSVLADRASLVAGLRRVAGR